MLLQKSCIYNLTGRLELTIPLLFSMKAAFKGCGKITFFSLGFNDYFAQR